MLSRNLEKAREAFLHQDKLSSRLAHEQKSSEPHKLQGKYLKSAVYGGMDGIITTFAVVAGVGGAALSSSIVLILGFVNLIADGLSMAIGDYLSTKSEREYQKAERTREAWELDNYPQGERKEMVEIYMRKGVSKKDAELAVKALSKNRDAFINIMMVEELGIIEEDTSPVKNALVTFLSFAVFGFVPLFAFVFSSLFPLHEFLAAIILTGATLFALGALRTNFTGRNWLLSGTEMLVVGGIAAGAAYLMGVLLGGLV
ncbi:MAG: VIT1/CCC1 transporter family protein [archaeon]